MEQLETCLRLLRASSDEEKFVGLYLVTKQLKTSEQNVVNTTALAPGPALRLVREAVGLPFLQRMLHSPGRASHPKIPFKNNI